MKFPLVTTAFTVLSMAVSSAEETAPSTGLPANGQASPTIAPQDPNAANREELERLSTANKLDAERIARETAAIRAEITRLKTEREKLAETAALEEAKRQQANRNEVLKSEIERETLTREAELAKARAEKLTNELKVVQTESAIEITRLQNEIARIEASEKRGEYADAKPQYLEHPLQPDGTLVISDRRIPLNGLITQQTADFVTERIQYWNNKDRKLPVFIVIDASPGGSVMAGYRILKAMEASDAPVHVVVKSLAASMAAAIATLAEESYAYPNSVILHHQISMQVAGQLNVTQQREFHEESQRWWSRFGTPIAKKMGITTEEFVRSMYQHSSSGDWSEFGEQAQQLKWVKHVIQGVDETSFTKNPDLEPSGTASVRQALKEESGPDGTPFVRLPRLDPKDVYFLYNPDGYYHMR